MGIPLQFSKAELKKNKKDQESEETMPETSSDSSEQEEKPEPPKSPNIDEEPCEEPCELPPEPCVLPDFCGLFDKAMQPFCPQPGININITIDMSKTKDGECDDEMKPQPNTTSFIRERQ